MNIFLKFLLLKGHMLLSLFEIGQFIILTLALGYIFSGFIKTDPYKPRKLFDWEDIKFAAIVSTPAVVLHEFGHKFVALAFGLDATFYVWGTGLIIGIILKAINSPFLFLAPAYVAISGSALPYQSALIAFAGPFVNLLIYVVSIFVIKTKKKMSDKELIGWTISKRLNIFLFIFNLIPIGPLDGAQVLNGLMGMF